jgi:hypothetical protein
MDHIARKPRVARNVLNRLWWHRHAITRTDTPRCLADLRAAYRGLEEDRPSDGRWPGDTFDAQMYGWPIASAVVRNTSTLVSAGIAK